MGLFFQKPEAIALLFAEKSVFLKWAYFWQKAEVIALHFSENWYFRNGPIFGKKQRL